MGSEQHTVVGRMTVSALARIDQKERPHYVAMLNSAFLAAPPTYGIKWFGDLFRKRGRDPSWVSSLMASNSYMEGYSAGRLWQYANILSDESLTSAMRRHAMDEAKHSKIFTKAVFKTFPSLDEGNLRDQLNCNTPNLSDHPTYPLDYPRPSDQELLSSMILINLFEIKALVLGRILQPIAVAHAPECNKDFVQTMLGSVIDDEAHHIRYSADFIEAACNQGCRKFVETALREFQQTLNSVTETELDNDHALEGNEH